MAKNYVVVNIELRILENEVNLLETKDIVDAHNKECNKKVSKKFIDDKLKPVRDVCEANGICEVNVEFTNRVVGLSKEEQKKLKKIQEEQDAKDDLNRERLDVLAEKLGVDDCRWSMDDESTQKLLDNEIFAKGKVIIKYDGGWGKKCEFKLDSPTYQDLWKTADMAVRASGDLHHIFLEKVYQGKDSKTFELSFGS